MLNVKRRTEKYGYSLDFMIARKVDRIEDKIDEIKKVLANFLEIQFTKGKLTKEELLEVIGIGSYDAKDYEVEDC